MKLEVSPRALAQVEKLTDWWDEHRSSAAVRVDEAFELALEDMLQFPERGALYHERPGYRTWPLTGTPYAIFYRVDREAAMIRVAAVWSTQRGAGPELG